MYKLTVISGPNRGTSYALKEGETTIGRQKSNQKGNQAGGQIVLPSSRVSKRHCVLVVSNGEVVVRDEGSSNGTFVNGELTKAKKLRSGDRVSVGEYVFEVAKPQAVSFTGGAPGVVLGSNVIPFPPAQQQKFGLPGMDAPQPELHHEEPKDFKGKAIRIFESYVMPIFYNMNLRTEWRFISAGFFAAFLIAILFVSISPLMQKNRESVIREVARRARFMAKEVVDRNASAMAQRMESKTEIGILESEAGVRMALLVDLDNRILAPAQRSGQYLANGPEAAFAVEVARVLRDGEDKGFAKEVSSSIVVAIEPLQVLDPRIAKNVTVAMAVISIDASDTTPSWADISMAYSETLVISALIGILILFAMYRLTVKRFEVLNDDLDQALKGEIQSVTRELKAEEFGPLLDNINSLIQRMSHASGGASDMGANPSGSMTMDDLVPLVRAFGEISPYGVVVCDPERKVLFMNPVFEDLTGLHLQDCINQDLAQRVRDQAFSAVITDIFSSADLKLNQVSSEDFEFSGNAYKVDSAPIGANQVKGVLIVLKRAEGNE